MRSRLVFFPKKKRDSEKDCDFSKTITMRQTRLTVNPTGNSKMFQSGKENILIESTILGEQMQTSNGVKHQCHRKSRRVNAIAPRKPIQSVKVETLTIANKKSSHTNSKSASKELAFSDENRSKTQ